MRAISLHSDVIVVTSAVLQVNCVLVRGPGAGDEADDVDQAEEVGAQPGHSRVGSPAGSPPGQAPETFAIDSPVLPDELDALPALLEQAGFPMASGLLATHGDWDHLLGRLAFPEAALGVAETTAQRLRGAPGEAQRALRDFDEQLLIDRPRPLGLGAVQALPVPGRCDIGARELQLHPGAGHTPDGMAIAIAWAGVLVAGDYLSTVELPTLGEGGDVGEYADTLARLRELVAGAEHVVPGHGPVLAAEQAMTVLEQDAAYLDSLREHRERAQLPEGRDGPADRRRHADNVAAIHLSRPRRCS
jgi:glyoxylase-like metal-dependent hydrolase (beta-lactamase superfamily II)